MKRWWEYENDDYERMDDEALLEAYNDALFERQISMDLLYRHLDHAIALGNEVDKRSKARI